MNEPVALGFIVAFIAGLLSFLSPCVLPLIPSYVTFVTGLTLDDVQTFAAAWSVLFVGNTSLCTADPTCAFVFGGVVDELIEEAKRYCIHDHLSVEAGRWNDLRGCWFNGLYTRVLPTHAVELTAAMLDRGVARTLERQRITAATLAQKQDLAAVIHLCGAGAGEAFARRGFRLTPGQRCGDHDVRRYLARVNALKRHFAGLAAG